jgi:hypothetical protein
MKGIYFLLSAFCLLPTAYRREVRKKNKCQGLGLCGEGLPTAGAFQHHSLYLPCGSGKSYQP